MIIFYLTVALFVFYSIGIQFERGGLCKILVIFLVPGLIIDILLNIFPFSLIVWDKPFQYSKFLGRREFTISDRLERFCLESGIRGKVSNIVSAVLNIIAPKPHIKNAKIQWHI